MKRTCDICCEDHDRPLILFDNLFTMCAKCIYVVVRGWEKLGSGTRLKIIHFQQWQTNETEVQEIQ